MTIVGYRMHRWIVLMFTIGSVNTNSVTGCGNVQKLKKINMTIDMRYGVMVDDRNNKPLYASLDNQRAFCAKINDGFFIQTNLETLSAITELKIQGFRLNGTNYMISAFKLKFSLDNKSWNHYTHDDVEGVFGKKGAPGSPSELGEKVFLVKGTGNERSIFIQPLTKPIIAQYVRLYPINSNVMCIRFDLYGCNVGSPSIRSRRRVELRVNKDARLSCSATGVRSLALQWISHRSTFTNVTVIEKSLKSELPLRPSYSELLKYDCAVGRSVIKCQRNFTCHSYYMFHPWLQSKSETKVVVKIVLPDSVTSFSVAYKNTSGVLLSWKQPVLNDMYPYMVNYSLNCNITGVERRRNLPLTTTSIFLATTKIYHPYRCKLKLVKNNLTNKFPFPFDQSYTNLDFKSVSIRPNVRLNLTILDVLSDSVKVQVKCNFAEKRFGVPKRLLVNAKMLSYANRHQTWTRNLENVSVIISNVKDGFVDFTYRIRGLKPWARYEIRVAVLNEDSLKSNDSFVNVNTEEGKPSMGPSLKDVNIGKDSVTIKLVPSMEMHKRSNGKLIKYELFVKPINKRIIRPYSNHKNFYHIARLLPGQNYTLSCRIRTKAGFGPYGDELLITTDDNPPTAPYGIITIAKPHQLILQWQKPKGTRSAITKYDIRVTFKNDTLAEYSVFNDQCTFNFPASIVQQVAIRAHSKYGKSHWTKPYTVSLTVPNQYRNESALIIGFSVAFGLFAAFVVICFIYFRRHYRSHPRQIKDDYQLDSMLNSREVTVYDDEMDEVAMYIGSTNSGHSSDTSTCNLAGSAHDPLPVDEFPGYINMVKQDDYKILFEDYKNQMPVGKCYSWNIADLAENSNKNRYSNICAYDHSRIVLKYDGGERSLSDYINANSIYGCKKHEDGRYKYIATQGPMEDTVADFWHMVWQEGCSIIIMLTNLKENDKVKCAQYWPHESTKVYGKIGVTLDKIDKTADYITRTFQLEQIDTKEQRTVRQFHFVPWPDHGVPDYPTALLSLRRRVRHYYEEGKPMIVHCSAGIGRTGCFILIDAMLERIDSEKTVDIFNYLNYMRTRRICMVQTAEQYIFAHTAVLEYITFGNTETFVGELDKKFKELVRGNGMTDEFSVLERNKMTDQRPGNVSKVLLREGIFVEAFKVDGFKQRDAFILTKAPSEENIISFWKMVLEKQVHTIVMLNKCQEVSQEYFKYWPDVEGHNAYQDIAVMMNSEVANGNIMTRKIKVTNNKRRCEVNHFQFVDWPDTDIPDQRDYNNICTLMQAVEKSQHNLGNGPIIVHSGNDYGRSGTFIAIYNSTERLKVEQLIDVLQCVRAIRITQPLAVDNVNQYQFVYNMLRTYLEGFENYCNYKEYNVCRSPFSSTSSSFMS